MFDREIRSLVVAIISNAYYFFFKHNCKFISIMNYRIEKKILNNITVFSFRNELFLREIVLVKISQ